MTDEHTKICNHCGGSFSKRPSLAYSAWKCAKYCSRTCAYQRHKVSRDKLPTIKEYLMGKTKEDASGCVMFTGTVTRSGYGQLVYKKKAYLAHRLSLEISVGAPPDPDMFCCHKCDTPLCVNPEHLYWGTPYENTRDAVERGQTPKGSRVAGSKLTEADIPTIRAASRPLRVLAAEYGVSEAAIRFVKNRQTWRHVP